MADVRIGVDLGGTKIEAIVIEVRGPSYRELHRRRLPTQQHLGYEHIVQATANLTRQIANEAGLDVMRVPVGVGMPGGLQRRSGLVKNSNTQCLNGRPFRQDLQAALGRKVAFDNDANCFALAEARFGAAKGFADGLVWGVIMGTGVGGGLVFGGQVWSGPQGIAGEWGHHAVYATPGGATVELRPCYCGQRGCVETYVSGPAVERDYQQRSGKFLSLAEIAAARPFDPVASAVIDTMLDAFGRALANVIDILDPSVVVLGGGVSNLELLYEQGRDRVRSYVFNDELTTPIVRHQLGDSAGVIGAALLQAGS